VLAEKAKGLIRRKASRSESLPTKEAFWALKNVAFEVNQGEVVGIIGRNGAGKSTLLKVLSRITEPTTGRVHLRGRVASLLEVGTGFHPELTGRENIFLNGAILGMSHSEIKRNFDEIVAFAGVERFLDTPVKRYSSGMQVRLAFAVAAHLQPEVLILDEVLAVGDAQFQKKCLGKMSEVSKAGRTILFVSHNMAAVKSLTTRGIVLQDGKVAFDGGTDAAVQAYLKLGINNAGSDGARKSWGRGRHTVVHDVRLLDREGLSTSLYTPGDPLHIEIGFETDGTAGMSLDLFLSDATQSPLGMASTAHFHGVSLPTEAGTYVCRLPLEPLWLASGNYFINVKTAVTNVIWDHSVDNSLEFEVPFSNPLGREFDFKQAFSYGIVALLSSGAIQFEAVPDYDERPALLRA
jgi:lipopolysaccharide transport system ATP-binding protein